MQQWFNQPVGHSEGRGAVRHQFNSSIRQAVQGPRDFRRNDDIELLSPARKAQYCRRCALGNQPAASRAGHGNTQGYDLGRDDH